MKKLFAYCRVSTQQQKENKNIEIQEREIKKYIKENNDKISNLQSSTYRFSIFIIDEQLGRQKMFGY